MIIDIHSASSLSNGVGIWVSEKKTVQDEHLDLAAFCFVFLICDFLF